ncbi:MAG: amidohydrolase family protein [Pseudonocardiaceae bacterium]
MSRVAIFADRVVIGPVDVVIDDGAILLDHDVVRAVGTHRHVDRVADAHTRRHSYPGETILPGLIDSHVHLAFDSGPDPVGSVANADPAALLLGMAGRAQQLLYAGVTTARDLGDRGALTIVLREAISRGILTGPKILAATTPLTSAGGHCGFLGGEVSTDSDIRRQIARNSKAGADLIKVIASGGALTPSGPRMWEAQFTAAQLRLIVRHTAEHGLSVAAHAHGTHTIADCVRAGVRTIEHCSWRTDSGVRYDDDVARQIAAQHIAVCRCVSGDWRLFLKQLGPKAPALMDSIRRMRQAGVRFIAGTDAGVPGSRVDDYVGMLDFFREIGFANSEIISMATVTAAHALGLHATGTLSPGDRADLLIVNGDPLTDLNALRDIHLVLAGGQPHVPLPVNLG